MFINLNKLILQVTCQSNKIILRGCLQAPKLSAVHWSVARYSIKVLSKKVSRYLNNFQGLLSKGALYNPHASILLYFNSQIYAYFFDISMFIYTYICFKWIIRNILRISYKIYTLNGEFEVAQACYSISKWVIARDRMYRIGVRNFSLLLPLKP